MTSTMSVFLVHFAFSSVIAENKKISNNNENKSAAHEWTLN